MFVDKKPLPGSLMEEDPLRKPKLTDCLIIIPSSDDSRWG